MRSGWFWAVVVAGVLSIAAGIAQPAEAPAAPKRQLAVIDRIDDYRQETWRWQAVMGKPRTPTAHSARTSPDAAYRRWVLRLWRRRADSARREAMNPPHRAEWQCIHRYEGAWTDGGPPYYGGLQMDLGFQRTYGGELLRRKGTANHWTPLEQMWVAERAHRSGRGFYPWPNTARFCGLI